MKTPTTTATLNLCSSFCEDGTPQHFEATAYFDTEADRDAFLALFPKSTGLRPSTCSGMLRSDENPYGITVPTVRVGAQLRSDGVNGGRNETGIKRIKSLLRTVAKHNLPVVWQGDVYSNAFPTLEAFEKAVEA